MNDKIKIPDTVACPSPEELSALHDGNGLPDVAGHAAACAACRKLLADYGVIDAMVARAVNPPADLTARIKAACRAESLRQRKPMAMWPRHYGWRLAAAAAACAAVAGLLVFFSGESGQRGIRTARAALPPELGTTPAGDAAARVNLTDKIGAVHAPELSGRPAAGASNYGERLRAVGLDAAGNGVVTLPNVGDAVQHVWVVRNSALATNILRRNLPRHAVLTDVSANGRTLYRIVVIDRDMQALVDRLAAAGFSLVSPSLPQPGANQALGVFGKPVAYTVELVPDAK